MAVKNLDDIQTLQDVFDTAVTRVLQNQQPAYSKRVASCVYRTEPDGLGNVGVCAVGALIPDELYVYCKEGQSVKYQDPAVFAEPLRTLVTEDGGIRELLVRLQEAHDYPAELWAEHYIDREEFQIQFRERASRVAKEFGLSDDALFDN